MEVATTYLAFPWCLLLLLSSRHTAGTTEYQVTSYSPVLDVPAAVNHILPVSFLASMPQLPPHQPKQYCEATEDFVVTGRQLVVLVPSGQSTVYAAVFSKQHFRPKPCRWCELCRLIAQWRQP